MGMGWRQAHKKLFVRILIFSVLLLGIKEIEGIKNSAILDPDEKYHVTWEVDEIARTITFEVKVNTIGYVGFGISSTGGMAGADIVIGGVLPDGSSYFQDRYAESNGMPIVDRHQDWTLLESWEIDKFTYLMFSRPINTCDEQDMSITGDAQRFIWAIGQNDFIKYHEADRGSFVINILDPPTKEIDLTEYQSFDAVMNVTMPARDTSYWCSVHRSPLFSTKQHTIAFGPKILDPVSQRHSHHLSFYQCKAPAGEDSEMFFESFIVPGGEDCFSGSSERSLEIYNYCTYTIYSWAIGARIMYMPEGVGFPISEGGREYFLLEMHLNNPGSYPDISFETGVEIYHTDDLRPIEAGTLAMGAATDWQFVIPPSSNNFHVAAHCSSICTNFMEPEGYTLFNVQLHAHNSARTMRLRQFRGGTELPWIADDQMYDNNFQNNRNIRPVKLLPGDHITLECGYDNTWVKPPATVIGGYSTKEEMCASVMYYYPKGRFSICGSENFPYRLMKLLGIRGISTRLKYKMNPMIIFPQELRGMTVLEYMNTIVNWTSSLRHAVENELTVGPHDTLCLMDNLEDDEIFQGNTHFTTYPEIDEEYQPIEECFLQEINRRKSKNRSFSNKKSTLYAM